MSDDVLYLDYETKSRCDLPKRGAYNYAMDPSTKPLCLGYAFNDEEFALWWPHEPFPLRIKEHFRHGRRVYAHNAAFDRLITWYVICPDYDVPEPPLESWYCTAVQSRANCGPSSLEDVGRFAGSKARKNYRGAQLIRALSLPRADGTFDDNPELMHEMGVYCIDDCLVMREVSKSMRPLSDEELHDYHVNERVNDRGVLVDRAFAQSAFRYSTEEIEDVQAIVTEITKGEITSVRSQKLKKWVMDRISLEAIKLMERYEDGEKKFSFDKTVRFNLLAVDDYEHVPAEVVEVIQCADDLWSSSVAKFKRMDELADVEDNRVRGAFAFAGGAATGRAASYGLQVHNFPRKCAEDPLAVRKATIANRSIVPEYGKRVTDVLKGMLRPSLIAPPGKKLIVYDWSGIEARVLPWLSQQPSAEKKLDVFRRNEDLYIREAAGIYHIPEAKIIAGVKEKDQEYVTMRQIGKVAVLALGFQGSVKAFTSMGKNYGVVLPESEVRKIVAGWRRANPWAVQFWQDLEIAYMSAMRNPGAEYSAGRITYLYDGEHLWYALPSGRVLCYPYAKLEKGEVTYAKASWKPAADAVLWPRAHLYGGLASENCWSGNTLLITSLGVKCIKDITVMDLIWDGYEFVSHSGVVNNGKKEVVKWLGNHVTKNHQIFDGTRWNAVIHVTEHITDKCLKWGRSLVPWKLSATMGCLKTPGAHKSNVAAEVLLQSFQENLNVDAFVAPLVVLKQWLRKQLNEIQALLVLLCRQPYEIPGYTDVPVLSPVAAILTATLTKTTGRVESIFTNYGLTTKKNGFDTQSLSKTGMFLVWTLIVSIMKKVISPVICTWLRGLKIHQINEQQLSSPPATNQSLSANSGENTALNGVVSTLLFIIFQQEKPATKLPTITNEYMEVFDVLNCGPRHQYMILTDRGPVIAHNCTQATANCLLRRALRECDAEDLFIVLHTHDEIVIEADTDIAEQEAALLKEIMLERPDWAEGLPLAVEGDIMDRYSK